jgi:guanylate kinase
MITPDLEYSVSCTTRPPREGEINGVSYYFLSGQEFQEGIERGRFLEWKEVHGNLYGTPRGPVEQALSKGRRMILDIDVQGAFEVFDRIPESVGIFITAPSMETIEKRLRARGADSEESIRIRLENAQYEMSQAAKFKYVVENDDMVQAAKELALIIEKESREKMETASSGW